MKTTMLLFLGVLCATLLQAQTMESEGAKPCPGQWTVPSDVEKEGTEPCHKPHASAVPVDVAANKPVAKPGPIRAEIALRDGSMLRRDIFARSLP